MFSARTKGVPKLSQNVFDVDQGMSGSGVGVRGRGQAYESSPGSGSGSNAGVDPGLGFLIIFEIFTHITTTEMRNMH